MSEGQDSRAERIARYKEQRRKELAAQFSTHSDPTSCRRRSSKDANSSGSDGPRTTRASRLRAAAATAQENSSSPQATRLNSSEKLPASPSTSYEASINGNRRVERDKSSKRKSNLNRSLNSEEVPSLDPDDVKNRRRRRRFFPQEVLDQTSSKENNNSNDDKSKSDTNLTASFLSQSSTSPITASPTTSRLTPRKSDLSLHMENARKGVTPFSEMGKNKSVTASVKRRIIPSNREIADISDKTKRTSSNNRTISRKMEELTALTKETLARVERLASKNKELPTKQSRKNVKEVDSPRSRPSSILKKKSIDEPIFIESVPNTAPVSILKRKVSQDDHRSEGASNHTPPVTFSPSVVEPATTNRKQGILKKRRSLDESQVMRHRSCSPDVANKPPSSSILKNQRRSSLEELTRTQSPELQLHGILKRKTSRNEEDDSLNSPQSILKRRSGASSAGSTSSTPHVSITTAVILAAAGGAEMILESDTVKPILKKKSISEEHSFSESSHSEAPKPILKKKSSTDTDDCEDRPKPILKITRNSIESSDTNVESRSFSNYKHNIPVDGECDVRPILKQNGEGNRPRLSFCGDREDDETTIVRHRSSRRSHTICAEFNVKSDFHPKEEDRLLKKPRPLSVSELVMNFETSTSTGAIPKKSNLKRNSDRYRTQPVTSNELEASLNLVRSPQLENIPKLPKSSPLGSPVANHSINSLLDFTSSLENDSNLNSFLYSLHNTSPDSAVCGKMSSDSAFQSLGDGLELDQDDDKPIEIPGKSNSLELQMKAIAEEAQKIKLGKGSTGVQKYRNRKLGPSERSTSSRFSTQPVTFDEVQEASRINKTSDGSEEKDEADPSNLSLFERIKLFNVKVKENIPQKRDVPRRRPNRFQTQPVTSDEVETARCIPPTTYALDDERTPTERRGILKSSFGSSRARGDSPSPHPRSVLKKRDSFDGTSDYETTNRRSILKTEAADVTYDEGISCNDSASDSETASVPSYSIKSPELKRTTLVGRQVGNKYVKSSSETSDGDSSGGREIRSIFKNENKLKVKQKLESVLSKSKSQSTFGDESDTSESKRSPIRRSQTQSAMPRAIEELQAKLQQSGETEWRKRVQQNNNSNDELRLLNMNKYNNELSEKSILEIKKDELDAASKQWKSRVEKSDAEKFSVAGRMEKNREESNLPINIPAADNKRIPQAKRFKGREGSDSSSTPVSPDKNRHIELTRSYSVPDPDQDLSGSDTSFRTPVRKVSVARPDDYTFKSFYKSIETSSTIVTTEQIDVSLDDFDLVTRQSLLAQKKNIQVQKRRGASKNPIKALALRNDICDEYTEVITGVAERERKRLNIEKLAKSSSFAPAALAGLVSKEDFKSVALKKSGYSTTLVPYKDVMLLHVKGRQHVQTRLVEPVAASINEGDNYILVTPTTLYNYVGKYSNIIEQSRASDIINHIQQSGDLGCKEAEVVTLNTENHQNKNFWKTLGCDDEETFTSGGNPDEDGLYETNILSTNMIYKLDGNELVPWEEYWGKFPKIDMLEPTKVIVFDFGSEMYVWSGKNAPIDKKKLAFKLAKEMWDLGYDYTECNICPLNIATILGNRPSQNVSKKGNTRPNWALFAKITQHRETILFKEKFLDWPDFSRIIKIKGEQNGKNVDPSYNIKPCDVTKMLRKTNQLPDLLIENYHLGRGDTYFDEETKRLFEFDTLNISVWRILENHPEQLSPEAIGHFYNSDSYIIKWNYRTTVKGRELSGKPSKYLQAGRDRCVYFCWQGSNASINEKGSAALLTVELDHEKAPQVRVVQGSEPAAFLRLFKGSMVVHDGKRDTSENLSRPRLYLVRGEMEDEICSVEVVCEMRQLRSRTSFMLIDCETAKVILWHGCQSSGQKKKVARQVADRIVEKKAAEFYLDDVEDIKVSEVVEGEESEEFLNGVGDDRNEYMSLLDSELDYDFTMRLFHLSSTSGTFKATEILCPHRSEYSSPYPFLQTELYSASQPALFLIDNHHELWLWQGWWPEREEEEAELCDQTGSGRVRWQAERKAAMQTCVNYWQKNHSGDEAMPAFLVWAGLEPLEFKNLFPYWIDREDVAELNLKERKKANVKLSVQNELALLLRTTYPLDELLQRPLPEGVDPTHLEIYLSPGDFQELLNMTKEEFQKLPVWKQTAMKKEKGLF